MRNRNAPLNPYVEAIAVFAVTLGVIVGLMLPGLAAGFLAIAGVVYWLNRRDDPRST